MTGTARILSQAGEQSYYRHCEDDFSITYKSTPGLANATWHIHDWYELLLCLSDDMFCDVGNKHYLIPKNTLLIFNNMDLHHFGPVRENGENLRYVVFFNPAYISHISTEQVNLLDCFLYRPFEDCSTLPLSQEEADSLATQCRDIIELGNKSDEECYGKELHLQLMLASLLLNVNTLYRINHGIHAGPSSKKQGLVYEIINYIHRNYSEDLSLDLIAKQFYVSKCYLCEIFKETAGMTPNSYIINCRIMKAKELLINGYSVESVCAATGFNNLSHFSRIFKSRLGISPKQYQLSFRNSERKKDKTS